LSEEEAGRGVNASSTVGATDVKYYCSHIMQTRGYNALQLMVYTPQRVIGRCHPIPEVTAM